jgi:hypothetical protein
MGWGQPPERLIGAVKPRVINNLPIERRFTRGILPDGGNRRKLPM